MDFRNGGGAHAVPLQIESLLRETVNKRRVIFQVPLFVTQNILTEVPLVRVGRGPRLTT